MKIRIQGIAIILLIAVSFCAAKGPERIITLEEKVELAKKNLLLGLRSDNTGLVESCIRLAAVIKMKIPSTDIEEVREELDKLSLEHCNAAVRYKAHIGSNICMNPEWFSQEYNTHSITNEIFFIAAANRLQEKLFGLNNF